MKRYLGAQEIVWQTVYDDATNTRKEIDPLGIEVAYQHDPLDRLRYVKWTEGGVGKQTEYCYDEADNRTAQLDANGNATSWDHDAMDRMTKEEDAAANARHFGYDGVGNVIRRVDAEGRVTTYYRDATGNETARIYGGYQIGEGEKVETEYDTNANRKEVRTPLGEWQWTYDALNRMIGRDEPPIGIDDPNYPPPVTAWYYDHNGNVERLIGPDGGLTDYEYDVRNRMTKVTRKDTESDPDPRITTYSYYENNLLKLKTLPNGCEAYHEYEELDRLTLLVNRKSDQTVISSFAIEYRNDDNKSKITREDGTVIEYDYDDQKRLTKEKWTAADQTVLHDFEYSYDAVGNRLTKVYNSVTTDYDYNNLNQLTQEETAGQVTTYGYDREGNTIRKTEPAKETLYSWNPENMLTKAAFSDSTPTNEFSYDGDGNRVQKLAQEVRQYSQANCVPLLQRNGEILLRTFAHGYCRVPTVGSILEQDSGDTKRFYLSDWLGSTVALADATETLAAEASYDGFGNAFEPPGAIDYGFASKEWEADGEVWGFGFRLLDPSSGRFLTPDPLSLERPLGPPIAALFANDLISSSLVQHVEPYSYPYARANPILLLDPLGLQNFRPRTIQTEAMMRRAFIELGFKQVSDPLHPWNAAGFDAVFYDPARKLVLVIDNAARTEQVVYRATAITGTRFHQNWADFIAEGGELERFGRRYRTAVVRAAGMAGNRRVVRVLTTVGGRGTTLGPRVTGVVLIEGAELQRFARYAGVFRNVGRVAVVVGLTVTACELHEAYVEDRRGGEWRRLPRKAITEAGRWAGAGVGVRVGVWGGARLGAAVGVESGPGAILTGAIGAILGGMVGGTIGYVIARPLADRIIRWLEEGN